MVGQTISHYRVVTQLGAGGMGVVFGADDIRLGRPVALKFIPDDLARDRHAVERFRVEARAASALNHANICTIHDIGEHEGQPFIVMEWLKGQTLNERLTAGPLKVPQLVEAGIEIADALDAAHAQGIVHRDIKPSNIFLTDRGHVKVMDFGLAKLMNAPDAAATTLDAQQLLTMPGSTLGTASYMSPEQAAGDTLDGRSDLFSVGIVLYECATGRRPFTGDSTRTILAAVLHKAPIAPALLNPDLPLKLQDVINCLLEKDPDLRYQNAAGLRADLKRVRRDLESGRTMIVVPGDDDRIAGRTDATTPPPVNTPSATAVPATSRTVGWRAASIALGVAGAIAIGLYVQRGSTPPSPQPAVLPATSSPLNREPVPAAVAPPVGSTPTASLRPPANEPQPSPRPSKTVLKDTSAPAQEPPAKRTQTSASVAPPPASPAPITPSQPDPPPARVEPPETTTPAAPTAPTPPPAAPPIVAAPPPSPPAATPPAPSGDTAAAEDDAAIRNVVSAYARAIETKDLALFRSLKPNLGADEERRIQQGFRAVSSQKVNITILSIQRHDDRATVQLRRQDIIEAGGRRQAPESRQTMTMARHNGTWVIVEIGR